MSISWLCFVDMFAESLPKVFQDSFQPRGLDGLALLVRIAAEPGSGPAHIHSAHV